MPDATTQSPATRSGAKAPAIPKLIMPVAPRPTALRKAAVNSKACLQRTDTPGPRAILASSARQVTATTPPRLDIDPPRLLGFRPHTFLAAAVHPTWTGQSLVAGVYIQFILRMTRQNCLSGNRNGRMTRINRCRVRGIGDRMSLKIEQIFAEAEANRYALHANHLNEQMVRVLKTIGFDVAYQTGQGQYLYDRRGQQYLDLLSGWGVFALGRNHPVVRDTLKKVLDSNFPNLVQMDVSALAGVLAERLLRHVPHLDKVFFANSGAESVEASLKFARVATSRGGI